MKTPVPATLAVILCGLSIGGLGANETPKSDIDRQLEQASTLFEQGHTEQSKKIYEELLPQLRNSTPSSQLGTVLNGLSRVAAAAGDYAGAIKYATQSSVIYHKVGDSGGEAHALNNQGIAEIQIGQYPSAQETFEAALEVSRRGDDFENQVQVLNNLGSSYYYPGSYSEALRRYDAAMVLVERNTSAKWSDYWLQITSFNQATLFQRLGRFEKALQIYRQVEQSSKSLTPSDRAHLYANLGALYRRLGDPYKAMDIYRTAQKLYADQHDAGGELTVMKNIGIVYALDMEDLSRAQEIFRVAISLAQKSHNRREEMQAHLYLGETLFRAAKYPDASAEFERSRRLADELGTTEEQWKSLYGLGRIQENSGNVAAAEAEYRQAIAMIEATRSQLQLGALRSDFFADKRDAYDALIGLLFRKRDTAEAFAFLERSRARNFQDRLQPNRKESAGGLTLAQTISNLPDDSVLLEFWTAGERVGLIWSTRKASGLTVKQLSAAELAQMRQILDGMPSVLNEDWRKVMGIFNDLLPDASVRAGIRHILIVPDGWISYVPFDLLQAAPAQASLLIETCDISYLPTAAVLRRPKADRQLWFPWTYELAAFGDPSVESREAPTGTSAFEDQGSQRLRFSAQEIRSISDTAHGTKRTFLQQRDLKKYFLNASVNNAFILHVSTHAFADGDSPEDSRMLFSPEIPGSVPDYVFLRELYDLKLSNVQLATISACDTERGKLIRGEGVQAFSRALLSAGAKSSLTTLWRVDDELTAEFMKQFYYLALHDRKPKAEALRLTKLKFLHSDSRLADPRLWAAFVLNGDGATTLPRVLSWGEMTLLLVILLSVGCLTFLALRRRGWSQR